MPNNTEVNTWDVNEKDKGMLEMDDDMELPMMIDKPHLPTGKASIDMEQGKLTSNVYEGMKQFDDCESCYTDDELTFESVEEKAGVHTMESVLRDLDNWSDDNETNVSNLDFFP